jgi:hypothetical protein
MAGGMHHSITFTTYAEGEPRYVWLAVHPSRHDPRWPSQDGRVARPTHHVAAD